jgi:hypothetical protein
MPFVHIYGISIMLLSKLSQGVKFVTLPRFEPNSFFKLLDEHQVTYVYFHEQYKAVVVSSIFTRLRGFSMHTLNIRHVTVSYMFRRRSVAFLVYPVASVDSIITFGRGRRKVVVQGEILQKIFCSQMRPQQQNHKGRRPTAEVVWRNGKAAISCSGKDGFKFRSRYLIKGFQAISRSFDANSEEICRLGCNNFLPNPLQFIFRQSPFYSTLYCLDTDTDINWPRKGKRFVHKVGHSKFFVPEGILSRQFVHESGHIKYFWQLLVSAKWGRAIAQTISRWLPTAAARVQTRV